MYSEYVYIPPQKQELSVSLGIWSQEVSEMSAGRRWLNAIKALYSAQEHGAKLLSLILHKVWYFDVGLKPWGFQSNLRLRIFTNKISIKGAGILYQGQYLSDNKIFIKFKSFN